MKINWEKVYDCKHENHYSNYYAGGGCATPYCDWSEYHCRDCGVFIMECGCGFMNGISGWSYAKDKANRKRRDKLVEERRRHNVLVRADSRTDTMTTVHTVKI